MFAQPADSGIMVAVAKELLLPDPEKAKAMEVLNGNERTDRDNPESSGQSLP